MVHTFDETKLWEDAFKWVAGILGAIGITSLKFYYEDNKRYKDEIHKIKTDIELLKQSTKVLEESIKGIMTHEDKEHLLRNIKHQTELVQKLYDRRK